MASRWEKMSQIEQGPDRSFAYQTNLSAPQRAAFSIWSHANNVPVDERASSDYDMPGFYLSKEKSVVSPLDGRPHFTDRFKTPYHRTFSNESQYATPNAPRWDGNKLVSPDGTIHLELPEGGR